MLITILSYFDRIKKSEDYFDNDSCESATRSFARGSMSSEDNDCDFSREDDGWEHVSASIPISIEEDYEVVIPTSDYPGPDDVFGPATISNRNASFFERMKEWHRQRSLQRNQLGLSISKTFAELSKEDPNQMEEDAIQRAMELSMLDVALVHSHNYQNNHLLQEQVQQPHKILNVAENACPTEIKAAYRRLARVHHPDKGGDAHRFEEIARAYRSLLSSSVARISSVRTDLKEHSSLHTIQDDKARLTTATCDRELQDHRRLVNDLFRVDGIDLEACVAKQLRGLDILGLTFRDAGATNRNERNETIHNSCFYLSLATSYLWGIGALSFDANEGIAGGTNGTNYSNEKDQDELLVGETALQLKRTIEAAVVKAHPEWVLQGKVGEEVQAFSDFLVYILDSHSLLSEWAVVVFDATSGFCDIYKGRQYENCKSAMQSNTITLRYIPGHYQPLIPCNSFARRPTLNDITKALDALDVFYVVTDGNS